MRRFLLPALLALSGCVTVTLEGADRFSGQSAIWAVLIDGNTRTHQLVVTSTAGWCSKKQNAERDRLDALERYQDRGVEECESTDTWLDDLVDAYKALIRKNTSDLTIVLAREGASSQDEATAPAEGTYLQVGSGGDGRFTGTLVQYEGSPGEARADAFSCDDDPGAFEMLGMLAEGEEDAGDVYTVYFLDAGEVTITSAGDDRWKVDLSADLLQGQSSVGTVETTFTAKRCEIVVGE